MSEVKTLSEAKDKLIEQDSAFRKILSAATTTGFTIKNLTKDKWLCSIDGTLQTVGYNPMLPLKPGLSVSILKTEEILSIVEILPEIIHHGNISKVSEILPDGRILIEVKGEKKKIFPGQFDKLKDGDEVFVYGDTIITGIHKAGKSNATVPPTGISWDDIGGLTREKELMREMIEHPIEHKEIYQSYNQKTPKGVLLYGPPGNGKTMLGKALATSLSKFYKTNINSFFYIKGPELLSQYVGLAEESIRNLFATTRAFHKEHGFPAVIFIDEAEAILSRRGSGISSDVEKTIVPQFLTEMDGISDSHTIVVLATNRPDMLDSAVLREGRIDKKIRIDNPDIETAKAIISLNMSKTCLADSKEAIEKGFLDEIFSEKYPLYEIVSEQEGKLMMHLRDITSGSTLANIVSVSISNAIRRDIEKKAKKASGILAEDAIYAIQDLYRQNLGYKHKEQIEHFAEVKSIKIKSVSKIK